MLDEAPEIDASDNDQPANKAARSDAIAKAYANAALDDTETRVADLIPTRPLALAVVFLLGLTVVVGVQSLFTQQHAWAETLGHDSLSALDVSAGGSVAAWLSSTLLGMAAVMATLVYVIRRHKVDDYRGRYRLWLWMAGLLLLASVDATAGLHNAVRAVAVHLSGTRLLGDGSAWWMIAAAIPTLTIGLQGIFDMRRTRWAVATLLAAVACYAASASLIIAAPIADAVLAAMAQSFASMMGHLLLFFSLALFARHVLLDARGLLPPPKAKKKKPRKKVAPPDASDDSSSKNKSSKNVRIDAAHESSTKRRRTDLDAETEPAESDSAKSSGQAAKSNTSSAASAAKATDEEPEEGSPEWYQLSKAERKRLRKLRRRQTQAS